VFVKILCNHHSLSNTESLFKNLNKKPIQETYLHRIRKICSFIQWNYNSKERFSDLHLRQMTIKYLFITILPLHNKLVKIIFKDLDNKLSFTRKCDIIKNRQTWKFSEEGGQGLH
jgi:hypothetical protein